MNSFLENHVLKKCVVVEDSTSPDCKELNEEIQLKEYELMVLIELHLMQDKVGFQNLEDTDVSLFIFLVFRKVVKAIFNSTQGGYYL